MRIPVQVVSHRLLFRQTKRKEGGICLKKWAVTVSTTEPFNYVGLLKVRQGNKQSEVIELTITENGLPYDLTGCRVTFQTRIGDLVVERACRIIQTKGIVEYLFDAYTMQKIGRHTANLAIYKGEEFLGTTQDFEYIVIQAVSKTPGEMGSYWQTVEDLIEDMKEYVNAGKGNFEDWFDSVKDILTTVDPGGKLLEEVMNARVDRSGVRHNTIKERLAADFKFIEQTLRREHYTISSGTLSLLTIVEDEQFSKTHEVEVIGTVPTGPERGGLVRATIGKPSDDTFFKFERVGEIDV